MTPPPADALGRLRALRDDLHQLQQTISQPQVTKALAVLAISNYVTLLDALLATLPTETSPPLAVVTESGWVTRRKSDGYIWSIGETGNPDARLGGRPVFHTTPTLGSLSPDHWETVYVTRTVTLHEPAPEGAETGAK